MLDVESIADTNIQLISIVWNEIYEKVNIPHSLTNRRRMLRAIQNVGSMHEGTTETNGEHTK